MTQVRTVSAGHTFLEGPRWRDGYLYASDFFTRRVLRWRDGEGEPEEVAFIPGMPSGLGFLPGGDLVVVSMYEQSLFRVHDGEVTPYVDLRSRVNGIINDMHVDAEGRCYVGGTGHGAYTEADYGPTPLLIVQPDGDVVATQEKFKFPNGIVQLSDGRLLVAETYGAAVRAIELDGDGLPTGPSAIWASWDPVPDYYDIDRAHAEVTMEPDGLAVADDDTVWVADAKGSGVTRVREGGEVIQFVDIASDKLSVFAPCVADSRLFMCCSPTNRTVDWSKQSDGELRVADLDG